MSSGRVQQELGRVAHVAVSRSAQMHARRVGDLRRARRRRDVDGGRMTRRTDSKLQAVRGSPNSRYQVSTEIQK
jgi:hypothetical protein